MSLPRDLTKHIAYLNDTLRRTAGATDADVDWLNGEVHVTRGIAALSIADQAAILRTVNRFDAFDPEDDPYCERDFGEFDHKGQRIFWKIDYYDLTLSQGSGDPADPRVTRRVLTIMLADEY